MGPKSTRGTARRPRHILITNHERLALDKLDDAWRVARRFLARSRGARLLLLPYRLVLAIRLVTVYIITVGSWLVRSAEHTNFTYDISKRNLRQLAWFVSLLTGAPVERVAQLQVELLEDADLREYIAHEAKNSVRSGLIDPDARFGRRVVWYTLVRIQKPHLVVETGVDKGLGTLVIASALKRNAQETGVRGRCVAIDINPEAGTLLGQEYAEFIDLVIDNSLSALERLEDIDLFIHDSDHDYGYEFAELTLAAPRLAPNGLLLSDAASASDALDDFSRQNDLVYLYAAEEPVRHWMRGQGVGVAKSSFRSS
jgi:Methyltransferase domain